MAGLRMGVRGSVSALLLCAAGPAQAQGITLDTRTTIVERSDIPPAVHKAALDLASDLEKVLGRRPRIVKGRAGPSSIEITAPRGGAAESFSISTRSGHVVLSGADMRGTIYAIYQFSQEHLGVDPMYFWTDREPQRRAAVSLPAGLDHAYPAPLFTYRGFFINDEDQLTGWTPGEISDKTSISLKTMDRIYETILRLKGNMVVPSSWAFPDDPQMKAASARGLILNQHHATPVGMNVARWPVNVPYNLTTHPEILERAWTNAVHSYDPKQEILWSVGLRGLSDLPYSWIDKSVVGNPQAQGALVSKAIREQMRIVRAVQPNAKFVTNLWSEGADLQKKGFLTIPPEVTKVWPDRGYGLIQDAGQVAKGQGIYYHTAMLNARANQLSEMVPVERIQSELGRFIAAGATGFFLVNTSDLRAVTMTTKATMDIAWGGLPKSGGAEGYYLQWATDQYGAIAAPAIAKMYGDYFKAFAHRLTGEEYGDQLFHTEVRQMLMTAMMDPPYFNIPGQSVPWEPAHTLGLGLEPNYFIQLPRDYAVKTATRSVKDCEEAVAGWDEVWRQAKAAEPLVAQERRQYYTYAVLTGIAMNRNGNHLLLSISRAVLEAKAGNRARAKELALAAIADFDQIKSLEAQSAYGKWGNWWRGEWMVGIDETRRWVDTFAKWLDDPEATSFPPPVVSSQWQGYYHVLHYEGDRTVDVR